MHDATGHGTTATNDLPASNSMSSISSDQKDSKPLDLFSSETEIGSVFREEGRIGGSVPFSRTFSKRRRFFDPFFW